MVSDTGALPQTDFRDGPKSLRLRTA